MKVMIVDDNDIVRRWLRTMLSEIEGVQCAGQAEDVPTAKGMARMVQTDVAILDMRLPGGNGLHVLAEIKHAQPSAQVIMFTDFAYERDRNQCLQLGADFVFDKAQYKDMIEVVKRLNQHFIAGSVRQKSLEVHQDEHSLIRS